MDGRKPLADGSALVLGNRTYAVKSLIGYGGTSFVYSATYPDSLQPNKIHHVLIKELFPYHSEGFISRDDHGAIVIRDEAADYFELRKKSFLRGNVAHIDVQNIRADMANVNIDSFEENGSLYTVIGNLNGETLQNTVDNAQTGVSVSCAVSWMLSLLDALEVFHKNNLLHLDISPDNILLLPLDKGKSEKLRKILLIDFGSVWNANDISQDQELYFSVKENYSAPEVRMREQKEISPATDLFSVCAVFLKLLTGKPLDFSLLYTGRRVIDDVAGVLSNAPEAVMSKTLDILRRGLKLPPGRRYQSIAELRADLLELSDMLYGEDVFQKLSKLHNKRIIPIIAISVALAFALSFVAIRISKQFNNFPTSVQEINAARNAMTALSASIAKLGTQIQNDINLLDAYADGFFAFQKAADENRVFSNTQILTEEYTQDSINAYKTAGSPMRFDLLPNMLNAPNDYRAWSDNMQNQLNMILPDESKYPEKDRAAIVSLYKNHIETYTNMYYIKIQLVVLPLNDSGKRDLLDALPYMPVFGDIFAARAFLKDQAELESMLETENVRLQHIVTELKTYGIEE